MSHLRLTIPVVVLVCMSILAVPTQAALLDLSVEHYPRVWSVSTQVTYDPNGVVDADKGLFVADGSASELYTDGTSTVGIVPGDFHLEAVILMATGEALSGSLSVTGTVDGNLETLFSSTALTDFGYLTAADMFEFLFVQEGSGLPPEGGTVGVILMGVSVLGSEYGSPPFSDYFDNNGNGYSNTFYLPEPTSAMLMMLAGVGFLRRARSRKGPGLK